MLRKRVTVSRVLFVAGCVWFGVTAQAETLYGLYAFTPDNQWDNPCTIQYVVAPLGAARVERQQYRLITQRAQKSELEQLRRQYSADGFDQPDYRFKLQSCAHWKMVQSTRLHAAPAPSPKPSPTTRTAKNFFLQIEIGHHAYGYWTYTVKLTERNTSGYIRRRQLRCFVGPMGRLAALQQQRQLQQNKQLLNRVLGQRMENDVRGFRRRSSECQLAPVALP